MSLHPRGFVQGLILPYIDLLDPVPPPESLGTVQEPVESVRKELVFYLFSSFKSREHRKNLLLLFGSPVSYNCKLTKRNT